MAAQFIRDHELTVWNRTGTVAEAMADETGARVAASPAEAVRDADAIVTCLPSSGEVADVLEGDTGVMAGIRPGALLVDCTSGDPERARAIGDRLAGAGAAYADAPVSGGVVGAEAGTLTAMVGADPDTYPRAREVLDVFCRTILHVGPVGAGHALKAVSNAILASNIIAVGEGITAAVKAGVPATTALEVLNASNARSFASMELVPQRALTREWPRTFKLALLDKDVRNALAVLDAAGLGAPLLRATSVILASGRAALGEEADHVEILKLLEEEAGVELRGRDD
jgi:3-hydroxyisobutyrate dehydrogenase